MVNPVLLALDFGDVDMARSVARRTSPHVGGFKVGLELLTAAGPEAVSVIADLGLPVFVDAKLHDIPNTVAAAARQLSARGARWVTAHVTGGMAMMASAVEGMASGATQADVGVLGVTVLTSLSASDLSHVGLSGGARHLSVLLAGLAAESGAEGVICSPHELDAIGRAHPGLVKVTPGIRPGGVGHDDQRRVATPEDAIAAGADWLVIGRAITRAPDPGEAAERIASGLASIP